MPSTFFAKYVYVRFYTNMSDIYIVTENYNFVTYFPVKFTTKIFYFILTKNKLHVVFQSILHIDNQMFYSCLTSGKLFLWPLCKMFFYWYHICACRTWCTLVSRKKIYHVSIIIIFVSSIFDVYISLLLINFLSLLMNLTS